MRNSILHPDGHWARLLGISAFGAVIFLFGLVLSQWSGCAANRATVKDITVPMAIYGADNVSGRVYLMDETAGLISLVGSFVCSDRDSYMDLGISKDILGERIPFVGVYWPGRAKSYIPHFQFLFNDDLTDRLENVVDKAKGDPAVQEAFEELGNAFSDVLRVELEPEVRRLLKDPGVRRDLLNISLRMVLQGLEKHGDFSLDEVPDIDSGKSGNDALKRLLSDHLSGSAEALARSIGDNKRIREVGKKLRKLLEPYFTDMVMEIAWKGYDKHLARAKNETPNARVLWVTRRIMFGTKNPAILLYKADNGAPLSDSGTFVCKVAK